MTELTKAASESHHAVRAQPGVLYLLLALTAWRVQMGSHLDAHLGLPDDDGSGDDESIERAAELIHNARM